MPTIQEPEALLPFQQLDLNARKGRFGIVYMRAIAGQAGCGFTETSPGEDTLAVDHFVDFPEGSVRVQVKTTATATIDDRDDHLTFSAEETGIAKWARAQVPLYFVIVVVPSVSDSWLAHDTTGTQMVGTAAYWVRLTVGQFESTKTIKVPRAQRVTMDTIPTWHADLVKLYTPTSEEEEAA